MSELSRMIGATSAITVLGVEYQLPPIQLRHITAAQAEMRNQRPPIFRDAAEASAGLPIETQKVFAEAAAAEYARVHTITIGEALLWMTQEQQGIAFMLWCMIRDVSGSVNPANLPTRDQICTWLRDLQPEQVSEMIDQLSRASGRDQLGNSKPEATAPAG